MTRIRNPQPETMLGRSRPDREDDISALTRDLKAAIDRLEEDCANGAVRRSVEREIHDLRKRAQAVLRTRCDNPADGSVFR